MHTPLFASLRCSCGFSGKGILAQWSDQSGHWITPHCSSFPRLCLDIWHQQALLLLTNLTFFSLFWPFALFSSQLSLILLKYVVSSGHFCLAGFYSTREFMLWVMSLSAFYSKSNLAQANPNPLMCTVSHWAKVADLHSITCTVPAISDFIPQIKLETISQLHKKM